MDPLAQSLDFANHRADSTPDDIKKLCKDVVTFGFHAAFVNPIYVTLAKSLLGNKAAVGTVISFPLGQDTMQIKMAVTNNAVSHRADELDIVPNIGAFFSGDADSFFSELTHIVESARMLSQSVIIKFILEPGHFDGLTNGKEQFIRACELIRAAGADYIKIGSGMGPRSPKVDDVVLVKEAMGDTMKIKVAGGITSRAQAEKFLKAGAHHLGTSHAIEIVTKK